METKFSPGPYHVEEDDEGIYIVVDALDHDHDEPMRIYTSSDPDVRDATAELIAAAPDLYAALEAWMRADNSPASVNAAVALTNLALAKARGETAVTQ